MFTAALEAYRHELVGRSAAPRTITNHIQTVERLHRELRFFEPGFTERLHRWYRGLQRAYERDQFSGAKVRNDISVATQYLDVAVDLKLMESNPVRQLRWPGRRSTTPRRDKWKPRPMPMDDVERLLAVTQPDLEKLDPKVVRDRAMLELFLNGLRRIEVSRLNTTDIAFDGQQETLVLRVHGKGDKIGDVPLNPNSASYLALHLLLTYAPNEWREWYEEFEDVVSEDGTSLALLKACERLLVKRIDAPDPVFWHGTKRITGREINRMFEARRAAAGLSTEFGPHSLRHTCATELLEQNVDSRVVQELLRHSSIAITQIYMDVRKGPKARAMRKLPVPGFPRVA